MEPQTGNIKAWVGGITSTQYDHVGQVPDTVHFFVYATAIEQSKYVSLRFHYRCSFTMPAGRHHATED
jgi:penicillin-binding protein 1A